MVTPQGREEWAMTQWSGVLALLLSSPGLAYPASDSPSDFLPAPFLKSSRTWLPVAPSCPEGSALTWRPLSS